MREQQQIRQKMDEFLTSIGCWRKQIAADGSCLFRAVSEHVYDTQSKHKDVRHACVAFMRANRRVYEPFVDTDFELYASNMERENVWGGHLEMHAMALIYRRDFLIFEKPGKPAYYATENGFHDLIMLCFTQSNHYDCVYRTPMLDSSAFCQSIVYGVLYKKVFGLGEDVDLAVKKMLYDKAYFKHKKNMTFEQWKESVRFGIEVNILPEEEQDTASEVATALANKIPPFPFKVAKALDPTIYRNVEYDVWNEAEKERLRSEHLVVPELEPGVKCLVRLSNSREESHSASFQAHVQKMEPNHGPITVFIEKLGKMCTVPFESVDPLPVPAYKAVALQHGLVPFRLRSLIYQQSLLTNLQELEWSQRRLTRKGRGKELSVWVPPPAASSSRPLMPLEFPLGRRLDVNYQLPPQAPRGTELVPSESRFGFSASPPPTPVVEHGRTIWSPLNPASLQQPFPYPDSTRYEAQGSWDFKPQPGMLSNGAEGPVTNGTEQFSPGTTPGIQTASHYLYQESGGMQQSPLGSSSPQVEVTSYYGHFASGLNATLLGQAPPIVEQGGGAFGSSAPYDYAVTPPPFSFSMGSTDVQSSTPSGSPSPGIVSNGFSSDALVPCNQDAAVMPQPLLSPSYSPLPVANLLVPWEQPSPAVNLAAQRSVDPAGGDLPSDGPTLRFFYNIGMDYFRMVTAASVQPCMFPPPVPGYNGSISVTIVPYVADPGFVVPDIHCTVPEATPMPNGGFPPEGGPPQSTVPGVVVTNLAPGGAVAQPATQCSYDQASQAVAKPQN